MTSNQTTRRTSQPTDLLSKIRPKTINKPNLVQHLSRSNQIPVSSGLKMLNTRIPGDNDPTYHPLVTISDNENSEEENFISPIHKLTKSELREELKVFRDNDNSNRSTTHRALLSSDQNDDDDDIDDIQFRSNEPSKRLTCPSYFPTFPDTSCVVS